jgi:RND family efflux transporter MFP subunit
MIATQVNDMNEQTSISRVIPAQPRTGLGAFEPRVPERAGAIIGGAIVLALVALGIVHVFVSGLMTSTPGYVKPQDDGSTQYVNVVLPKKVSGSGEIFLPGTLHGYIESPIYSRATGYVLHWYADIGTRVTRGQVLAILDTPEIDQELAQAIAQRNEANATLALARTSYERWQELREHDVASEQALEERQSTYMQDVASLEAADANVQRLRQLEAFKRIVAPFSGVITQRNVDIGDLVYAGNVSGRALFAMVQADPLRVYVQLPQAYAQNVKQGQDVTVTQAELPGQRFHGSIAHISGAIDASTRSLQLEVRLPNPDNRLRPGAYVQVALRLSADGPLLVPDNVLVFRSEGPRVAVVGQDGKVQLRKIVIRRDLGESLEIESGIGPADKIIINPSDSIADGEHVRIVPGQQMVRLPTS